MPPFREEYALHQDLDTLCICQENGGERGSEEIIRTGGGGRGGISEGQ